jgi:glycosyltransferase involved in cell wall biosynthesis
MKIILIDVLGLPYNYNTLETRGLGGSESSVIRISRELVKLGFEVTVINDHISTGSSAEPDGVHYIPIKSMHHYPEEEFQCDIMISSRSVKPFRQPLPLGFEQLAICQKAHHRVLWMHDTFVDGENDLEPMVMSGAISEIFTLSDWHTVYVTNCTHGNRRNFEVLKNRVFQTRNGVEQYQDFVDIKNKDKKLWVFNASYTKGMEPTVKEIWPRIKDGGQRLIVIGGYYRFPNGEADQQETDWQRLVRENKDKSIDFTGVITQREISRILTQASYFLAPGQFPETFGISALEATAHNVPVIASRFGALEETCVPGATYFVDYTLKNNPLFQVDEHQQLHRFVEMCKFARDEEYIWQQKAYGGNIVKDIIGWDGIALQWKQHFYRLSDKTLEQDEYQKVKWLNYRVHKVFGRRVSNFEDFL